MSRAWIHFLLALALCCALSALMFYVGGPLFLVTSLAAWGALAWPLINLLDDMRLSTRRSVLEPLSGIHYSFQGLRIHVFEDEDYSQWVPADDVRKVVGRGANDRMLALTYPDGWCVTGKPARGHLRDDALLLYLAKENSLRAIKFKVWVERHIAFQANKRRQQHGIRITDPRAPDLMPRHLRDTEVPRDMRSTLPQS